MHFLIHCKRFSLRALVRCGWNVTASLHGEVLITPETQVTVLKRGYLYSSPFNAIKLFDRNFRALNLTHIFKQFDNLYSFLLNIKYQSKN